MRIVVTGTVQGVGFRPAVYRAAQRAGASGTVRNDGSHVTIRTDRGEELIAERLSDLPPLCRIEHIERFDEPYGGPSGFSIIESEGAGRGASIPADSAVCGKCLEEMDSPGRRRGYPFTTCTGCGPRFTLLRGRPYVRPLNTLDGFPMCPECGREFASPGDRRFHHQTVACPACGPRYWLETREDRFDDDPIGRLAEMLDSGARAVVKGWGGTHICCTLDGLEDLREWYGRRQKPFAIMARDMDSLKRYGDPTAEEEQMLRSPGRPIVLVRKVPSDATDLASPGLDSIGMFLPYTGMHHILFSELEHDALVMTSANPPGEPMAVANDEARRLDVDAWLLHDQEIANRADDTVLRIDNGRTAYIRRSRGSVPYYIESIEGDTVALGAQENLAGAVASGGRIWPTQYVGNGEKIGVPEYLEEAVRLQMRLVGCEPRAVAIDLHPGYANRKYGKALAEETGAERVQVQHHWAHAASLMAEKGMNEMIALTLDGTGHGDDGTAWGGEVLRTDYSGYDRVAHLQPIPLVGSDRARYDLRRLTVAIDGMNGVENTEFPDRDAEVLRKLMPKSIECSSMGRVLDALSHRLGVCSVRTYDGEPSMKLERLLNRGRLVEGYEARSENGVVMTAELFARIDPKDRREDVAYSIVHGIVSELVDLAAERAESEGIKDIGLTGGVSYNGVVSRIFEDTVKSHSLNPVEHSAVPNGDGGISVGQAAIALERIR